MAFFFGSGIELIRPVTDCGQIAFLYLANKLHYKQQSISKGGMT